MNKLDKSKLITILMGGSPSNQIERDHSIDYGNTVYEILKRENYLVNKLLCSDNIFYEISQIDEGTILFNAILGKYGEDGILASLLELKNISYTGSGPLSCAISRDKKMSKLVFNSIGIDTPHFQEIHFNLWKSHGMPVRETEPFETIFNSECIYPRVSYPVIIKPKNGSFSLGRGLACDKKTFISCMEKASIFDNNIIIEKYIPGFDAHVPILNGLSLVPIEKRKQIDKDTELSTYSFKVRNSIFIIPGRFPKTMTEKLCRLAETAYNCLGCRGLCRADFRVTDSGNIYILEINTQHSIREKSMALMSAKASNINPVQLVNSIIESRWMP